MHDSVINIFNEYGVDIVNDAFYALSKEIESIDEASSNNKKLLNQQGDSFFSLFQHFSNLKPKIQEHISLIQEYKNAIKISTGNVATLRMNIKGDIQYIFDLFKNIEEVLNNKFSFKKTSPYKVFLKKELKLKSLYQGDLYKKEWMDYVESEGVDLIKTHMDLISLLAKELGIECNEFECNEVDLKRYDFTIALGKQRRLYELRNAINAAQNKTVKCVSTIEKIQHWKEKLNEFEVNMEAKYNDFKKEIFSKTKKQFKFLNEAHVKRLNELCEIKNI